MLLTDAERAFLAIFIREATTDPFQGPTTSELHLRDIYYTDLPQLLTAYYRESPPAPEGIAGPHNLNAAPCPWPDREAALHRDREVGMELERMARYVIS
jgi:hypothetical protein